MTRLICSSTQWLEPPACARCGQKIEAGDVIIVADHLGAVRVTHQLCSCPTCGKSTSGSEEWSTGECDDCFLSGHDAMQHDESGREP